MLKWRQITHEDLAELKASSLRIGRSNNLRILWINKKINSAKLLERITIDPAICHDKPCLRGLRYPVEMILELLSAGMTFDEILADYEDLEREDIFAALAYATRLSQVKRMQAVLV